RGIVTARGQQMVLDDLAINHVLDPRDPWDVSQPIQDSLAAITAANRASCFAAHDPERNRILWFFNDATPW
ncbi:MAG: hypothetical protein GWN07_36315, partial [Actinobacteria bacterium]|nr:hypothetical protein [Actinomycetota bacterium]NIS36331.1 hypothetical protein [Actinomycetota bacterium]NIU70871.1 hypothetical protein [Actinomycetota bacterium]NIW32791.1 hypothetical protein [Actinomycetota bacterium]NIX24975.1 hypothetical protein [Actinomycetota bacterium]